MWPQWRTNTSLDQFSIVSLCAIPVKFGLNYGLIVFFQDFMGNGGIGAGIATVVTELGIMVALISITPRGTLSGFRSGIIFKSALAGLATVAAITLVRSVDVLWLVHAFVGVVVFAAVVLLTGTLEDHEVRALRRLMTFRGVREAIGFLKERSAGVESD